MAKQMVKMFILLLITAGVLSIQPKEIKEEKVGSKRNQLALCSCKSGNRTLVLGCVDTEKGELFPASNCLLSYKPDIVLSQCVNKKHCLYRWNNKRQAGCGTTCNEEKTPKYECLKHGEGNVAVEDDNCQYIEKPVPKPYFVYHGWSQCSRTCGDGVQYRQAECMRKFENGTTQEARDCSIDEITDLVKPCYNEPCEFSSNAYVVVSPVDGRRRRARGAESSYMPAVKAGTGNHWQPKARQRVNAIIGDRVSAVDGARIFLKCVYGGKPEPRAAWYMGKRRIDTNRYLPYQYSYKDYVTTLEIPSMKKYLAGTYTCRVENRFGVVKAHSEVRMLKEGEATIFSQRKHLVYRPEDKIVNITIGTNATIYDDSKVNIVCPVQAYPFKLRIRWQVEGVKSTRGIRRFGYYGTDLQIIRATKLHSGTYICHAESYLGSDSEKSTITVISKVAPKIQGSSKKVFGKADGLSVVKITIGDTLTAEDGAKIEISCPATGSPQPKITWLRRGVPIQLPMINMFSKEDGRILVIKSMQKDASDTYTCVARNVIRQVAVDSKIMVLPAGAFAPQIESRTGTVFVTGANQSQTVNIGQIAEVFAGKPLTVHCPAKGLPKPDISWEFEGKDIKKIEDVNLMVDKSGGGLMIVEVNRFIAGKISCIAQNVLGSSKATSRIKILESSQPKILSTGSDVRIGRERIPTSVAVGSNLKTSGGRKVKIICAVSGWPIPKVFWYKNGKPVVQPTSKLEFGTTKGSMLVIDAATEEDSGLYTCYAINPAGVAMSSSNVKVLSPGSPVITSRRSTKKFLKKDKNIAIDIGTNITTLLGNSLIMQCPFEGDSEAKVEWTVDSQPISFNRRIFTLAENALRISDVTFFDSGVYVCNVSNSKGFDSEASQLRISAPHNSILKASNKVSKLESYSSDEDLHVVIGHNVTVTKGHNIFITCPVRGILRPKIAWMKGSEELKSGQRVSVEGEQLLLTDVTKEDSGTYYCFAKTEYGTSNSSTHLTVIVPTKPVIYKSSRDIRGEDVSKSKKIIVGDQLFAVKDLTIEIACRVTAGIPKPRISWYHNSVKIVSNGVYSRIKENNDLLIPKLDASLQGVYKCVAENLKGKDEAASTIMITLSVPPNINKSSKHITESSNQAAGVPKSTLIAMKIGDTLKASSGRNILIDCEANGIPKPRVIWTKDNDDLASSGRIKIFSNGSLLLQEASEEDSGDFACTVINNRGVDMFSSKVKIMGRNNAMVVAEEQEEKVEVNLNKTKVKVNVGTNLTTLGGKSLTLLCPTTGEPKPRVFWYKDAIEIEASDEVTFGANGELILEDVRVEDAGRYTCMAENEFGKDKMSSTVNVAVLPENLIQVPAEYERSDLKPRSVSKSVKMNIGMFGDILSRKTVVIECPTKGSIKPKFTWLLNGKELKANGKYKIDGRFLKVINQEAGDYEFTCRAETFLGNDEMKSNIRFIDPVAPVIEVTKKNKVITEQKVRVDVGGNVKVKFGSQLDIRCPFAGVPIPEVRWFRNGERLAEDDDVIIKGSGKVLRIPFVRMDDNATYACEVSNGIGKKVMEEIEVGVFKPMRAVIKMEPSEVTERSARMLEDRETIYPTIIREENKTGSIGQNYSILVGMKLVLKCPAGGDPKPEIVWLKNGEVIAKDVETLILERASVDDNGVYLCKAINAYGGQMMSSQVFVMEQKKPVIQRDPVKGSKTEVVSAITGKGSVDIDIGDDLKTLIGTEISIKCPAIGVPAPKVSFYKGEKLLAPSEDYVFDYDHGLLTIKKAAAGHEGYYSCVAENTAGATNMTSKVELLVPIPPHIQDTVTKPIYKYDVIKGRGFIAVSVGNNNISAYPGTALSIDCPVTGFPLPEIIWSKDGKRLNPEYDLVEIRRNGTLVLPHLTNEMNGAYECFAVNVGGGNARNITVSVVDPVSPTILKGSGAKDMSQTLRANATVGQDIHVLFGAELFIKCPFKAEPEGVIMWSGIDGEDLKSRGAIEVDGGRSLFIPKVTKESSGVYKCIVSNVFGSDSAKTTVTVTESLKPMITTVKENVTTYMGTNEVTIVIGGRLDAPAGTLVSISCPVSGSPKPNIKWLFNGKVIYETKMTSDSEAASYTISKLRLKDAGVYTCLAENVLGSHKASTYIEVGLIPSIQSLSTQRSEISAVMEDTVTIPVGGSAIVKTGSTVLLQCFTYGKPTPIVKWYRDGNLVEFEKRYASYIVGLLEIKSVSSLDDGSFTCSAKNKFGATKATAKLVVVDPPTIARQPENRTEIKSANHVIQTTVGGSITVLRGVQLIINCPAKGIPEPKISWKRLNAYHDIDPRVGLTVDHSLKINDITSEDAGTYICIAKNTAGVDRSAINVHVAEPPSAELSSSYRASAPSVDPINRIVVSNGKSVTIICTVKGRPLPLIKWFKEGKQIKVDGVKYHTAGDELYIHSATAQDAGNYRCVAENMAGRNTATFDLIVGESPRIIKGTGNVLRQVPTTLKAVVGQSIGVRQNSVLMIFCEFKGKPAPLVNWNKNGKEVDPSLLAEGNKILLLKKVSFADAGNYTCMVESELGADQATSELVVIDPPRIKDTKDDNIKKAKGFVFLNEKKVKKVNVFTGETIKVVCMAIGFPIPKVQWLKNMHVIDHQTNEISWTEKQSVIYKENKVIGKVYAVLTMKVVKKLDVLIGCKAYSSARKTLAKMEITVHDPPKAPYKGAWVTVPSDVCNGECVKTFTATQMLQVECRTFDRKRLPEANCDPKLRPYNRKECHTKRCATSLIVGSWGSCSSPCGNDGFRRRTVKCVYKANSQLTNDRYCSHISPRKPRTQEPCNRFKCVSDQCVDSDKYCHLVKNLGYCGTEWSKRNCCLTCTSGKRY